MPNIEIDIGRAKIFNFEDNESKNANKIGNFLMNVF